MNTITNSIFKNGAITVAIFALAMVAVAPVAHATDLDTYWGTDSIETSYASDVSTYWGTDSITTSYTPDMGTYWGTDSITTSYTPYDSWSSSGFGGSSFFGGGFGFGGGYGGGSSWTSSSNLSTNNGNTYTYAPTNTNVCTGGNVCNDNSVFNAPTTVTVSGGGGSTVAYPVYPPVVYSQPYPIYTPPAPYYPPVQRAPYVSLSAAPYTGLELGPLGTALYWSFLVLWCLVAAYLIVVKKVQNKIVAGLNSFLFGTPAAAGHAHTAHVAHSVHSAKAPAKAHAAPASEGIDPFIASQIHRGR